MTTSAPKAVGAPHPGRTWRALGLVLLAAGAALQPNRATGQETWHGDYATRDGVSADAAPAFTLQVRSLENRVDEFLRNQPPRGAAERPLGEELKVTISGHSTTYRATGLDPGRGSQRPRPVMDDSDLEAGILVLGVATVMLLPSGVAITTAAGAVGFVAATVGLLAEGLVLARTIFSEVDADHEVARQGKWIKGVLWVKDKEGRMRPFSYRASRYESLGAYLYEGLSMPTRSNHFERFIAGKLLGFRVGKLMPHNTHPLVEFVTGEIAEIVPEIPGGGGGGPTTWRNPITGWEMPLGGHDLIPSPWLSGVPSSAPSVTETRVVLIQAVITYPALPVAVAVGLRAWQAEGVTEVNVTKHAPGAYTIAPVERNNRPSSGGDGPRGSPPARQWTVKGTPSGDHTFGR